MYDEKKTCVKSERIIIYHIPVLSGRLMWCKGREGVAKEDSHWRKLRRHPFYNPKIGDNTHIRLKISEFVFIMKASYDPLWNINLILSLSMNGWYNWLNYFKHSWYCIAVHDITIIRKHTDRVYMAFICNVPLYANTVRVCMAYISNVPEYANTVRV